MFSITRKLRACFLASVLCLPATVQLGAAESGDTAVWIDVRSARDFRRGHIEGAINIPHGDIGHMIFQSVPDTFIEVHLYDGSGGTFAGLALELLMELGFQAVYNEGGYEQLLEKIANQPAAAH